MPTSPTLYNKDTGVTATPNANVTPEQQASAQAQGFTPITPAVPTSATPVKTTPTITADGLAPAQPYTLPNTPVNSTTGNLTTATNSAVAGASADASATPTVNPEKEQAKGILSKLMGSIGNQATEAQAIRDEAGLATKKAKAVAISNELDQTDKAYRDEVANIKSTFQGTTQGLQDKINVATDRYQNNRANIALTYKVASGDYQGAEEIANQKINALKDQNTQSLQAYQLFVQSINNDLTDSEKLQVSAQIKDKENKAKIVTDAYADVLKNAVQNKAPASVLSAIDTASKKPNATASDIYSAAGDYGIDSSKVLDTTYKNIQINNAKLEGEKLKQAIDSGKPVTGEYAPVINAVSSLVGATKAPAVKNAISTSLANGDFNTAYANIANAVEDSLTGSNKTKFADARTDIGVMSGMRNAIKAYADAGGDMGLLKGSADTIAKNFGQLVTDPKFASLAVQLQREFQSYRNNMTGAAFSPAESKEYASVNPRSNASLDLNLATIDGSLAQLQNRVTSTVNQRIPEAQKIYDLATGNQTAKQTVKSNGQDYIVGQVYNDGTANWVVDSKGKWTKQ